MMEPAIKITPPKINVARLPARSAMVPPAIAPSMAPISTTLTTTSSICVESANVDRTKINAAAMIPMSNP
jgi:hypothetical protein